MRLLRWVAAAAILSLSVAPASAEEGSEKPMAFRELVDMTGLGGSLRTGYWSSNRRLDDKEHLAVSSLWLKAAPKFGPNASLFAEGWVSNEDLFHAEATHGELREGYLDLRVGPLDLRIGKQIIAWGRADKINPTDNLTPRDFTRLFPEDDDSRLGTPGVRATYHFGPLALTGIALPVFEETTIPVSPRPPRVTLKERLPANPVSQWAIKLEQAGGPIDWSLSYFDGFDLSPDVGIDTVTREGVQLLFRHHRLRVVGADAATNLGSYGLRAEAAYTFTEDQRGLDPFVKNNFFFMVLGVDRTIQEHYSVNLQYIVRVISEFESPRTIRNSLRRTVAIQEAAISNQLDSVTSAASLRVNGRWLNQTLEAETSLIISLARFDYVLRPKVMYALTDHWRLTAGLDFFRGTTPSLFGRLRDNTAVYVEARLNF